MKARLRVRFVFAALVMMSVGLAARLADATRAQMRARARIAIDWAEKRGYSCRNELETGELEQGEHFMTDTILYGGNDYLILGAAGDHITDLDLELYDANWRLIDADKDADRTPMIQGVFVVRESALAHLKVIAYRGSDYATAVICYRRR